MMPSALERAAGREGVIRITRGVIDKAGLNRLLVPHQSPLLSSQPIAFLPMPVIRNTYSVPFDPINNSEGEYATAKMSFNRQKFRTKRGSAISSYPSFADVYKRSERIVADGDTFEDLMLDDMVQANKRWADVS
jgi:hypothetical protein